METDERPDNAVDLCKYLTDELIYNTLQVSGFNVSLTRVRMILEDKHTSLPAAEEDVQAVKNLQASYKYVLNTLDRNLDIDLLEAIGFRLRHEPRIDLEGINEIEDPVYQAIEAFVSIIRGGYEYLTPATISANWVLIKHDVGLLFFDDETWSPLELELDNYYQNPDDKTFKRFYNQMYNSGSRSIVFLRKIWYNIVCQMSP